MYSNLQLTCLSFKKSIKKKKKNFYFSEISLTLQVDPLETCPIMVYFYMQSLCFEPMYFLKIWEQPI